MNEYQADIMARFGVPQDAFFRHESDMYVGCSDRAQAAAIRKGGPWESAATIFRPNKGSDMGRFPFAVDIPFAYLDDIIAEKKAARGGNPRPPSEDHAS